MSYKLIFFGSQENSKDLLENLSQDKRFSIRAAVTQPDRPVGRKQTLTPTPVAQYAESNNIITLKPPRHPQKKHLLKNPKRLKKDLENLSGETTSDVETLGVLQSKSPSVKNQKRRTLSEPDILLSYDFGQLIPPEVLALFRLGGLNIHFSLLPSYRGGAPIPWQIANGETQTGISVVKMSSKFDQGLIIYQESHSIKPYDTSQTLHQRLSARVLEVLPDILANYAAVKKQRETTSGVELKKRLTLSEQSIPSYFPRLTREHGFISWNDFRVACGLITPGVSRPGSPITPGVSRSGSPGVKELATEIERKIRAFSPWPGVWTLITPGVSRPVPLTEGASGSGSPGVKEKRLKIFSAKLKNGKLVPKNVQLEGGKEKSWKDFLNQYYSSAGEENKIITS